MLSSFDPASYARPESVMVLHEQHSRLSNDDAGDGHHHGMLLEPIRVARLKRTVEVRQT